MATERKQVIDAPIGASLGGWQREVYEEDGLERCRDFMTGEPSCCVPGDSVRRVAQIMRDEQVSIVPIVDHPHHRRIIGAVIDRDLTLAVVADGRDPLRTPAASVMRSDLVTCHPDDTLLVVLCLMHRHQQHRLMVVDNAGRLAGVIDHDEIVAQLDEVQRAMISYD